MQTNTRELGFVKFNEQVMDFVKYNGVTVYEAWKELIASGIPPLTLLKCKQDDLVDYKIYGNSVQDGTPTPDTPVEIESVGEKSSNLFNPNAEIERASIGYSGIILDKEKTYTMQIKLKEGKTVPNGIYFGFGYRYVGGTSNSAIWFTSNTGTITRTFSQTPSSEVEELLCCVYPGNQDNYNAIADAFDIMLVEGAYISSTMPEYEPYGYKIPVKVSGKNLVDIPNINSDTGNGTTIKCNLIKPFIVSCQEYPTSIVNTSGVETSIWRLQFNFLDGTAKLVWDAHFKNANQQYNLKINASEENPVISIVYRGTYIKEGQYSGIQIEYGEEITDYEPYIEPITTNIYLNEPLRKIRDYADYIDFKSKKVIRSVVSVDMGTLNWVTNVTDGRFWASLKADMLYPVDTKDVGYIICNGYKTIGYSAYASNDNVIYSAATTKLIYVKDTDYIDASIFKNAVTGIELCYTLVTPTEENIEPPNIPTHAGTNIIEIDTSITPSNMEVEYYAKGV